MRQVSIDLSERGTAEREGVEEGTERLQRRLPAERTLIPPDTAQQLPPDAS